MHLFFVVLVLWLNLVMAPFARATVLCEQIMEGVEDTPRKSIDHSTRVEKILGILHEYALKQHEAQKRIPVDQSGHIEEFDPRYWHLNVPEINRTFHAVVSNGVVAGEPFFLDLPAATDRKPWDVLSITERVELVESLATDFRNGTYDNPDTYTELSTSFYASQLDSRKPLMGLAPILIYRNANDGNVTGICRMTNPALAGLMGELGAPKGDVTLVRGRKSPTARSGHIWLRYRPSRESKWIDVDATPRMKTEDDPGGMSRLLLAVKGRASEKTVAQTYPFSQQVIYFLETQSTEIHPTGAMQREMETFMQAPRTSIENKILKEIEKKHGIKWDD